MRGHASINPELRNRSVVQEHVLRIVSAGGATFTIKSAETKYIFLMHRERTKKVRAVLYVHHSNMTFRLPNPAP